jgi:hypothetical protein
MQPFARVGIRHREQRGIGDVQVVLVNRDLHEVIGMFLFESVALDLTPARGL